MCPFNPLKRGSSPSTPRTLTSSYVAIDYNSESYGFGIHALTV
jgi:hypothetical protein